MSEKKVAKSATDDALDTFSALVGPPPLLEGEDRTDYNELLARVSEAVKPADIFEEMWVSDIVSLTWDISRWRRLEQHLITASTHVGVRTVLVPMRIDITELSMLIAGWATGIPDDINRVKKLLASANLSVDAVTALTVANKISEIERIDGLVMNAEMRRNAALREIERHRTTFGKALRSATDEVVDAEFEPVEAPQIDNKKAA
jgi:hypothetical protein